MSSTANLWRRIWVGRDEYDGWHTGYAYRPSIVFFNFGKAEKERGNDFDAAAMYILGVIFILFPVTPIVMAACLTFCVGSLPFTLFADFISWCCSSPNAGEQRVEVAAPAVVPSVQPAFQYDGATFNMYQTMQPVQYDTPPPTYQQTYQNYLQTNRNSFRTNDNEPLEYMQTNRGVVEPFRRAYDNNGTQVGWMSTFSDTILPVQLQTYGQNQSGPELQTAYRPN